jgi:hypothetical protein
MMIFTILSAATSRTKAFTRIASSQPRIMATAMKLASTKSDAPLDSSGGVERLWNLKGLRDETERQHNRTFKKISRVNEKLQKFLVDQPSEESKESVDALSLDEELKALRLRLESLDDLKTQLQSIRSSTSPEFSAVLPTILSLNLADSPPSRPPPAPKKPKAVAPAPRKPYHVYRSIDDIEIRVGREAEDNDQLSTDPSLRDDNDWWLHVSGLAGSHVVIRYTEDDLFSRHRGTVIDAAILAIKSSKAKSAGGKVPVTLTRCRNISKPRGAKPGLVQVDGDFRTINVDVKAEQGRLQRLTKAVD